MTHGLFFITDSQYRILSAESCNITRCTSTETIGNNSTNLQFAGCLYRLFCKKCSHIIRRLVQRNSDIIFRQFIFLCLSCHFGHSLYRFHRIFSICSFTTQHQSIRPIINSIGNISNLRTGRTRIINHGMQHLGSHDYRFLS